MLHRDREGSVTNSPHMALDSVMLRFQRGLSIHSCIQIHFGAQVESSLCSAGARRILKREVLTWLWIL